MNQLLFCNINICKYQDIFKIKSQTRGLLAKVKNIWRPGASLTFFSKHFSQNIFIETLPQTHHFLPLSHLNCSFGKYIKPTNKTHCKRKMFYKNASPKISGIFSLRMPNARSDNSNQGKTASTACFRIN